MYALPPSTLLSKQIPKKAIFEKFSLSSAQRQHIDADIARIDIVAQLSPQTLPAIAKGTEVEGIYVMNVSLKTKDYHPDSIKLLARLIPQRMLFALCYEYQAQLAIFHEGFHTSPWSKQDTIRIPLEGLNFDAIWEHVVTMVGSITITNNRTLNEQISFNKEQNKLQEQIAQLERKMDKEKQLGKKMELWSEIKKFQSLLDGTKQ